MRNPYEVLGISSSASIDEVKSAYKKLAMQYHSDPYSSSETEKMMEEINQAYDTIILSRCGNGGAGSNNTSDNNFSPNLSEVREKIKNKKIDDAEIQLDGISPSFRTAEWYFLKGVVNHKRGWFEDAKKNFTIACQMDPSNTEYRDAFNSISASSSANGGYRSSKRHEQTGGCGSSLCTICNTLICADCCCDCLCGNSRGCC